MIGDYEYLDRSTRAAARRIRAKLDEWFANYPVAAQPVLAGRFAREEHHYAALFELFSHALLERMGFDVVVTDLDPESRLPDFLCRSRRTGRRFYWECATLETDFVTELTRDESLILRELKDIPYSGRWLSVLFLRSEARTVSVKRLRSQVESWLGSLSPAIDDARHVYRDGMWFIEIHAIGGPGPMDGRTFVSPIKGGFVGDRHSLRKAVRRKANHFPDLPHPLVLALASAGTRMDSEDEMDALFGNREVIREHGGGFSWQRDWDGAWVSAGGPRNTRVTAVAIFRGLRSWSLHEAEGRVWRNPYRIRPLPRELRALPTSMVRGPRLQWGAGSRVGELLGLSRGWLTE